MRRIAMLVLLAVFAFLSPGAGVAVASKCLAFVDAPARVMPASLRLAQAAETVEILYVGHSTFRLRTPAGVVIATDYAGYAGPGPVPTVVTMNHAHETHYTDHPDPAIAHVLRGWNPAGDGPAMHDLLVGDAYIRNVPSDIRRWGAAAVEPAGNSIFIFEVADLCIGHLGHLHQTLSPEQRALIGRLDVVFAPVDGSYTLDIASMIEVLNDLKASIVIPMHFFGTGSLRHFLAGMSEAFEIAFAPGEVIEVSIESLPDRPTVLVPWGILN